MAAAIVGAMVTVGASEASAQSGYCDRYARDYANRYANPAGNVLGGAAAGAIGGAVIGGIVGGGKGAGRGAAIGAGVGALGGAAGTGGQWNNYYYAAYNDCMARNAGGPPRPVYGGRGRFEPWTPAWYRYCQQRYRSFNPQTGYFRTGSGQYRFCQ
ncbi:BA14K family protein [Rhodoligotrophos defluvii]|uniref:BA14K family protein n=1 Tax=Rhodoligotrophos defluvii TaxID=2561934 RepID=UPI0030841392